jgi:hypothetical protein
MAEDIIGNVVEEVEEIVEELFPPRPGGLVDRHRKAQAEREAAQHERENAAEPVTESAQKAVKVAVISPEIFIPITYTIAPGSITQILPRSVRRSRSLIQVITAAGTIVLSRDQGAALSGTGFTVLYGIPVPLNTRAQVWAYNNTGSNVQVSVISELYDSDKG